MLLNEEPITPDKQAALVNGNLGSAHSRVTQRVGRNADEVASNSDVVQIVAISSTTPE